jgi:hypothetical protein
LPGSTRQNAPLRPRPASDHPSPAPTSVSACPSIILQYQSGSPAGE